MRLFARLLTLQLCLTLEVIPKIGMPPGRRMVGWQKSWAWKLHTQPITAITIITNRYFSKKKLLSTSTNLVAMLGERDPPRGPKLPARCADALKNGSNIQKWPLSNTTMQTSFLMCFAYKLGVKWEIYLWRYANIGMIWSGSISTSKTEPPISQEGAKQDWAKWNMPIASENADFPDPFVHMEIRTQPIGNWNQLMLFQALVAHNNLCEPWKLPCLFHQPFTNKICKVLPEFCNPSSTLPPGNSTCSRQTSALKRRWLASSSSFGCAGSTSKASWRSQIESENDRETLGPLWKTTKQN